MTLKTGKMVVVYKTEDSYYSSDVNSTAFDFPLVDANIFDGEHTACFFSAVNTSQYPVLHNARGLQSFMFSL